MLLWMLATAGPWVVVGPDGHASGHTVEADLVSPVDAEVSGRLVTRPQDLAIVAASTLKVLDRLDEGAIEGPPGILARAGVSRERMRATLAFIADKAASDPAALRRPGFWREHFELVRWQPDAAGAAVRQVAVTDQIRLTRYLVFQASGSPVRTAEHDTALYAPPDDAIRLSLSRAQVYAGAFEAGGQHAGGAEPLVWLSREGVEQALLQGTVEVSLSGESQLFNVARSNEVAWDPAKKPAEQARYWYFRKVDEVGGFEHQGQRTTLRPMAAVAGDLANFGLGTVFALERDGALWVTVLADTGGAFQPNLFQLDLFTGTWPDREAFVAGTAHVPDRAHAWVLLLADQAAQ